MRTPVARAFGAVWLAALVLTAAAALLTVLLVVLPELPVPLPLASAALLVAAVVALLATPLALAPGQALAASLAADEHAPIWGTDRADVWGDVARAARSRQPLMAAATEAPPDPAALARAAVDQFSAHAASLLAALHRDMGTTSQAMQAAINGAVRIDGAAQHVEARLAHGLRLVEHVAGQLAALRPAEAEAVHARAAAAVASVEQAAAMLASVPPPAPAPVPAAIAEPSGDPRIERALLALTEALARLVARPEPADLQPQLEEIVAILRATPAPAEAAPAIDPALPDRLESLAARLERAPDASLLADVIRSGLDNALAAPVRQVESVTASLMIEAARLDTLALRLESGPTALAEALADAAGGATSLAAEAIPQALAPLSEAAARLEATAAALAPMAEAALRLDGAAEAIAQVPARVEAVAAALEALPEKLEARVAEGAGRIESAAAALGSAAAGAVSATHRATSKAAEELIASADAARAGLANAVALTDQAAVAQRALRAAAEHLAALGAETGTALAARAATPEAAKGALPEAMARIDGAVASLNKGTQAAGRDQSAA